MDVGIKDSILAIVTTNKDSVSASTVPVFYVEDSEKQEYMSLLISKITMGMVHDLGNGVYVIVKH